MTNISENVEQKENNRLNIEEVDLTPGKKRVSYSPWKLALLRLWNNKLSVVGLSVVLLMIIIVFTCTDHCYS